MEGLVQALHLLMAGIVVVGFYVLIRVLAVHLLNKKAPVSQKKRRREVSQL